MDKDSRFDSIFDAKRFIDANTGKGMVNPGMAKSIKTRVGKIGYHLSTNVKDNMGYKHKYRTTPTFGSGVTNYFNSMTELKKWVTRVEKDRGLFNPGLLEGAVSQITSFIPVKGIRKNADGSISLLVDSAKKALAPITGMLKGVGKVSILGNKGRKRR